MAIIGETLASGAPATCDICGSAPKLDVYRSAAGHYLGTYCECGPYSRESGYYRSREEAQRALDSGEFSRSKEYFPGKLELFVAVDDDAD